MMHSNLVHNWFIWATICIVVATFIIAVIAARQRHRLRLQNRFRRRQARRRK